MNNNIEAFKALIDRYETITLGEIQKIFASRREIIVDDVPDAAKLDRHTRIKAKLTGFGFSETCILCLSARSLARSLGGERCEYCVFKSGFGCLGHPTYKEIRNAKSSKSLLQAYRNRAKYLKTLL